MKKYPQIKLSNLVSFKTGKLNSNAAVENGDYPFFTCSQEVYKTNTFSFDTECVLLGGNNANGIYPIKYFSGKFDAYQRTYIIESLDNTVTTNRWIFYALSLELDYLRKISTGAATKFLTLTILNNLALPLPKIEVQNKIILILSSYDYLIENNNRRIAILEEMAQRLYREWFVHFHFPGYENAKMVESEIGLIPEDWTVCELGNFINLKYGKALKKEIRDGGKIPVYGSSGVVGFHSEHLSGGPGIILGRKGNVGSVYFSHNSFYPIDTVYYVESSLSIFFLYYLLKNAVFISGDSAVPGLNREVALRTKVLLPCETIIEKFGLACKRFMDGTFILETQNENLSKTRNHLLFGLISGDIDVSDMPIKTKED